MNLIGFNRENSEIDKETSSAKVGYRGYRLSKFAILLGTYVVTILAVALFIGKIDGNIFIQAMPWIALLGGVGPAGHQASNVAERWGGKNPPQE